MLTIVPDEAAYVVERLGRYHRTLRAGVHFLAPLLDRVAFRYSLLPKDQDVADTCVTRDNVTVAVASRFRWQIADPERAAYASASETDFIVTLLRTLVRQWIGARVWDDIRETTRELEAGVLREAAFSAEQAGVKVVAFDVQRIERRPTPNGLSS